MVTETQKPPEGGFAPSYRSNWGGIKILNSYQVHLYNTTILLFVKQFN